MHMSNKNDEKSYCIIKYNMVYYLSADKAKSEWMRLAD